MDARGAELWPLLIVLVVLLAGAAAGWAARAYLQRRRVRRAQGFFGLHPHGEAVLVVPRDGAGSEWSVTRRDTLALMELSALVREGGAHADVVPHDGSLEGFGERTEFCLGPPPANRRTAAHLGSLLPGVSVPRTRTEKAPRGEDGDAAARGGLRVGDETYRMEPGVEEHVLLARLSPGAERGMRPVFLLCGQRPVTHQAAARYLARNYPRLARRYGSRGTFCLLLKVVNSQAYGPDVVELVGDVTKAATTPAPRQTALPAQRTGGPAQPAADKG